MAPFFWLRIVKEGLGYYVFIRVIYIMVIILSYVRDHYDLARN